MARAEVSLAEGNAEREKLREEAEEAMGELQTAKTQQEVLEDRVVLLKAELKELKDQDVWSDLAQAKETAAKHKQAAEAATEREKATKRDNALLRLKLAKAVGDIDGL